MRRESQIREEGERGLSSIVDSRYNIHPVPLLQLPPPNLLAVKLLRKAGMYAPNARSIVPTGVHNAFRVRGCDAYRYV